MTRLTPEAYQRRIDRQRARQAEIHAQRAAKHAARAKVQEDFEVWWEQTVPLEWLSPETVPHGTVKDNRPFRPLPLGCPQEHGFLRWFAEHQTEIATIWEMVREAEVRYRALLKLLHERTTPNTFPHRLASSRKPMFTRWHEAFPLQEPFRVCWTYPGYQDLRAIFGQQYVAFGSLPFPHWNAAEGTSRHWNTVVIPRTTLRGHVFRVHTAALFPGEHILDPYEPLIELSHRFKVYIFATEPISMYGTWTKDGTRFYRNVMRPSLVTLHLPPETYGWT